MGDEVMKKVSPIIQCSMSKLLTMGFRLITTEPISLILLKP